METPALRPGFLFVLYVMKPQDEASVALVRAGVLDAQRAMQRARVRPGARFRADQLTVCGGIIV